MKWIDDFGDPETQKRREEQVRIANAIRRQGKAVSAAEIEKQMKAKDRNLAQLKQAATNDDLVNNQTVPSVPLTFANFPSLVFGNQWVTWGDPEPPPNPLAPELTIVEAVTGWRRWSVNMFENFLFSNNKTKWEPYQKLAAECKAPHQFVAKECRGIHCDCGIYAYKTRAQSEKGENRPTEVTHIWGEVYLWGRIVEHARGWRGQFGYPKSFIGPSGIAGQLARAYGVQVIE